MTSKCKTCGYSKKHHPIRTHGNYGINKVLLEVVCEKFIPMEDDSSVKLPLNTVVNGKQQKGCGKLMYNKYHCGQWLDYLCPECQNQSHPV